MRASAPKQLKTNAVTSTKIRKSAVTTAKIKDNNVTGDKILESSLGKVPDADKLDGNDATVFERAGKITRVASFSLGNDETKQIYSLGPLTLTAKCQINSGGTDRAMRAGGDDAGQRHLRGLRTRASRSSTPATPEFDRLVAYSNVGTGISHVEHQEGFAAAPDGSQFVAQLWAGSNILNQPNRCSFGGLIEQVS